MLRQVHNGKTKPITWVGEAEFPAGHIEEVSLMLEGPDGEPIRATGTFAGKLEVNATVEAEVAPVTSDTSSITRVAAQEAGIELLAANPLRKGFKIYNDSDKRIVIAFDNTVSDTHFTLKMNPDSFYDDDAPFWQGDVWALWETSPSGAAQITELT